MTDRPIPFSAPMVLALLDGRKMQTRRVINPQPPENVTSAGSTWNSKDGHTGQWTWLSGDPKDIDTWGYEGDFRLHFAPDDRLYVREEWSTQARHDHRPPRGLFEQTSIYTRADQQWLWPNHKLEYDHPGCAIGRRRAGMHMPRWASRITLIVEDVRVERLQSISEADAIAEGVQPLPDPRGDATYHFTVDVVGGSMSAETAIGAYRALWNSINGPDAWEANPWIVAVSFRVIQQNIDQIGAQS